MKGTVGHSKSARKRGNQACGFLTSQAFVGMQFFVEKHKSDQHQRQLLCLPLTQAPGFEDQAAHPFYRWRLRPRETVKDLVHLSGMCAQQGRENKNAKPSASPSVQQGLLPSSLPPPQMGGLGPGPK